jgi:5-methyltetrahydrofolate--homocysteine methyltransferase
MLIGRLLTDITEEEAMLIIGERINSSRKPIAEAIVSRNKAVIQAEARAQAEAGAGYIDINAGSFVGEEEVHLRWLIDVVQEASDCPLCIDSPDHTIIKAVLPLVKRPPMINLITLEPARLEGILPLVTGYKARLIGLCQAEDAMAESSADKLTLAHRLVEAVTASGVPLNDFYIDPLVYPLATNPHSALATLDAIEKIMKAFPGVHTTCGLTNISYGLPLRNLVNRCFLTAAIVHGLDSAIIDPTDKKLYGSLKAALMVMGKDDFCMEYVTAFREGRLE